MKYFPFLFILLFISCQTATVNYNAAERLSEEERTELLQSVIRYLGKLPGKVGPEDRFDARHDEHYAKQAAEYRIDLYYEDAATGDIYFMASRIAPSLYVKRVGAGVKMRREGNEIAYYEEVFRTWKMAEEELAKKGALLFGKMVKGEDLSPWYTANSGDEEYIEFPDEHTHFDTEQRIWVSDMVDPLAPYYQLKNQ
jgi:hypothetical protein